MWEDEWCDGPLGIPLPCDGPFEMPKDSDDVLSELWWYNTWTDDPDECDDQLYYFGMVHPSHGGGSGGAAYRPGDEAWGFMNLGDSGTGVSWYIPHGGATMAHELGHSLGRRHVDCPVGSPTGTDNGYPYNTCNIGPNNPAAYYGFNIPNSVAIAPTAAGDLMSYAHNVPKPRWPSDYTYRALFNAVPRASAAIPDAMAQAQELLVASGTITLTEGTAVLKAFYRQTQGTLLSSKVSRAAASQAVTSAEEAYHIRLLDSADTVLIDQPFQLPDVADDVGPRRSFNVIMPYHADTTRIVLMRDTTELASRSVSSHAPSVNVLWPNGGETIGDTLTIRWESQDADSDRLFHIVQYSPDLGATWRVLAINHISTTLTVRTDALPGSQGQALIRVTATDGVNTAIDMSDGPFTLQSHPPRAYITMPEDGAVFDRGSQIIFFGRTLDAEDGSLAPELLAWSSDRDGPLGAGGDLAVSDLSPGWHTISLKATDSEGRTAVDSITIFVSKGWLYLPLISNAP